MMGSIFYIEPMCNWRLEKTQGRFALVIVGTIDDHTEEPLKLNLPIGVWKEVEKIQQIRSEVRTFAFKMSKRLDDNEHRGNVRHWSKFHNEELIERAIKNLRSGDYVDAGNYCMMLDDNSKEMP